MLDLETLDPGIRRTVAWLRAHGFNTTDSGDGVTAPDALDYPHVAFLVEQEELVGKSVRLAALLSVTFRVKIVPQGHKGPTLCATFDPADSSALLLLAGVNDALLYPE